MKLVLTDRAKRSLEDILVYGMKTWGEAAAEHYMDKLFLQLEHLKSHPYLGPEMQDLNNGARKLSYYPNLIIYRVENRSVIIDNVIDGRSDILRLIRIYDI